MSEKPKNETVLDQHNQETINAEKNLLWHIQSDQAAILAREGIIETAQARLAYRREHPFVDQQDLGQDALPTVSADTPGRAFVGRKTVIASNPGDPSVVVPAICFEMDGPDVIDLSNNSASRSPNYQVVYVGEPEPDGTYRPAAGFTMHDMEVVENMLNGLQYAKDSGVLAYLNPSLSHIMDPREGYATISAQA